MANKDPAFLFYSADFLVGVADLTDTEIGKYIKLICFQHQKGHLSLRDIKKLVGKPSEKLLSKFSVDENGCYYNKRVEDEIIKRQNFTNNQREKVLKRWGKNDTVVSSSVLPFNYENEIKDTIIDIDNNYLNIFNELYNIYPDSKSKKALKEKAFESFKKIENIEKIFETMKKKIFEQISNDDYFPPLFTWLDFKYWEKE